MNVKKTYTAFVSYSHKDDKWARWLLRALESYQVPRHLVGIDGINGTVPARLSRIFRDREELAAGTCLNAKIREALERSRTLLVVCSPNAVDSYGVNEEIKLFREMRGDEHIFYIIKDGEPFAEARGLDPALECFPKELLNQRLNTSTAYGVPLAADARPQGDGRKMALMKVVAGILGVNLDTLVRRDLQRRQRRLWSFMISASAGMILTTALATQAYLASREAEDALDHARRQQDETESLISYIVDDLGLQLWRRGHSDLLKAMSERVLDHYDSQNSANMGPMEIARKVRGLSMLARTRIFKGDIEAIADRLEDLRLSTMEVIERHPVDVQVLQTHILTLKLLSDIRLLRGEYDQAGAFIKETIAMSEKIYALDPSRHPDDKATLGNALIDLAWVKAHAFQETSEAYALIRKGLDIRIAVGQMPRNIDTDRRLENVGGGYHHLSLIQEIEEPLDIAIASRQKCLDTYLERQATSPNQYIYKLLYFRFHNELAALLIDIGRGDEALAALDKGQAGLRRYLARDQENYRYLTMEARADLIRGIHFMTQRDWAQAESAFALAKDGLTRQPDYAQETTDTQNWVLTAKTLHALSLAKLGQMSDAEILMAEAAEDVANMPERLLRSIYGRKMLSVHINARAELALLLGDKALADTLRTDLTEQLGGNWRQSHPVVRFELMKAYAGTGNLTQAAEIAENLQDAGYARPDFLLMAKDLLP